MTKPIEFGEIKDIKEGHWFKDRKEMMAGSFHRSWGRGIDGNGKEGTPAIVLSGGYEDDMDEGDEIIYTGAGGNDPNTGKQVKNQTWDNPGNAGLLVSMNKGLPVRVIRGFNSHSKFSPKNGYTYAGLYSVVDAWIEKGKSNFEICRFRLVYSGNNIKRKSAEDIELNHSNKERKTRETTIIRVIRDTKTARDIKTLYNYECQICGVYIPSKKGRYAEGAHIKPLGKPHNGDDNANNLLCLCPNHHVMLDNGTISIAEDMSIIGEGKGILKLHENHKLNLDNLNDHRKRHGYNTVSLI